MFPRIVQHWWRRGAALWLVAAILLTLRLIVYSVNWMAFKPAELWDYLFADPLVVASVAQCFVISLCCELMVVLVLCALVRRGPVARALARLLLLLLLWINVVGTVVFVALRSYVHGFQLQGLTVFEVRSAVSSHLSLGSVAALLPPVVAALLFGREGSAERQAVPRRRLIMLSGLGLATGAGVLRLLANPAGFPSQAHSPATLFLVGAMPSQLASVPRGNPAPADWAPPAGLAPRWAKLAESPRRFNVVVLVLESVRAASWRGGADAPPLPHVDALAPHAVSFTRAYAHEPFSLKALEALLFGIYPRPTWEMLGAHHPPRSLPSVADQWHTLGMRTAFLQGGDLFETRELERRGFDRVTDDARMREIDPRYDDRTLVRALEQFLDSDPGGRFGAILWNRQTHKPYLLPVQKHPPHSHEAYLDAVAFLDQVVGDLSALLERRHLWDDTVLVLVADHGEAFNEHGDGYEHGDGLYESSSHIPLMLVQPRLFHGEQDARIVQQKDVAASLCWLAGAPELRFNQGGVLFGNRPAEAAYLLDNVDPASLRAGLLSGDLKYQFAATLLGRKPLERLFDVRADPTEAHDLIRERPREAAALKDRLFGWLHHFRARWEALDAAGEPARSRVEQELFP